jgi:hypothetical protein
MIIHGLMYKNIQTVTYQKFNLVVLICLFQGVWLQQVQVSDTVWERMDKDIVFLVFVKLTVTGKDVLYIILLNQNQIKYNVSLSM